MGENDWTKADLMNELNTDYIGNVTIGTDKKWYNDKGNTKTADMPTTTLSTDAQKMIDNAVWNLGGLEYGENSSSDLYKYERGTKVYSGRPTTWTGKVALMYPSDYIFATNGGSKDNRMSCLKITTKNWKNDDCSNNDWLYYSSNLQWTLSQPVDYSFIVFSVYYDGFIGNGSAYANFAVRPTVFLKSSVKITSGKGTEDDPYKLSL